MWCLFGQHLFFISPSFEALKAEGCSSQLWHFLGIFTYSWPDSVAQLDARPTGDQEAADSTPTGLATFFQGNLIMKYFLLSFSPFC